MIMPTWQTTHEELDLWKEFFDTLTEDTKRAFVRAYIEQVENALLKEKLNEGNI